MTGWEKTQSLLSERNNIQRKLQKALVGCAKETKRLDRMEDNLRSFEAEAAEGGDRGRTGDLARGASKDTSTTYTQSSGDDDNESHSSHDSSSSGGGSSVGGGGAGANYSTIVSCESSSDEEDVPPQQHLKNFYLPAKYDGLKLTSSPGVPSPIFNGRDWSMIYEGSLRLSAQCSTMQRQLDVKDARIEQLYNDNQAIIHRFERAKENHTMIQRKYEGIMKKMCTKQVEELSTKNKTIEEQRKQIQDRENVIQKLLEANKKLEVALGAMTKVASDAIKAKNKVREDLKLLKTSHLQDIMKRKTEKNSIRRE